MRRSAEPLLPLRRSLLRGLGAPFAGFVTFMGFAPGPSWTAEPDDPQAAVRAWIDAHHAWNDRAWRISESEPGDAGADRIAAEFAALLQEWFEGRSPRRDFSFGTDPTFHRVLTRIAAVKVDGDRAVVRVERPMGPLTPDVHAHDIELVRSAGRWRLAAIHYLDGRQRLRQY